MLNYPKKEEGPRGWYNRGRLQHFDGGVINQFITFRLWDSLPNNFIEKWRNRLDPKDSVSEAEYRKKVEMFLDRGHGECFLKYRKIAEMIRDSLLFHHNKKYILKCWVIMPNHLHILLCPKEGNDIASVMHSIKSFTAHEANKILDRTGRFWQPEYYDRFIRNEEHFRNVFKYIERNPVKAGLCTEPGDWEFSSAFGKYLSRN